ncbi:MAG: hypothetical protein CMO20_06685 [Thermoplasmata archaeon]|nr:hypothetical protein [Thermoplasmata archaeon]|tara:strand:+ start:59 stop:466 length:408 start_codon:yes stop_codon:yes gene_type:complete
MNGDNFMFQILRAVSMLSAGIALFLAGDVFLNGGSVVDYTSVCAFGVTACALGILARIEQADNLNDLKQEARRAAAERKESREKYLAEVEERATRRPSPVSRDTNSTAVCRNCGNKIQPDQNFCEQCGWQRINPQ